MMCLDCHDEGPVCDYCGMQCFGTCDDPDTCPDCWGPSNCEGEDEYGDCLEDCMDAECACMCHEEIYELMEMRFEAGVLFRGNHALSYVREGIFPFLRVSNPELFLSLFHFLSGTLVFCEDITSPKSAGKEAWLTWNSYLVRFEKRSTAMQCYRTASNVLQGHVTIEVLYTPPYSRPAVKSMPRRSIYRSKSTACASKDH